MRAERRHAGRVLACLMLLAATPALAAPQIETWTTGNGARVLFIAAPALPMVDVELVFAAGSARDGALPGLASLTNGLLAEGTEVRDATAVAAGFESRGARFSLESQRDMAALTLRSLTDPELLWPAVDLLAEVVARPAFTADAFARDLARMRVGLQAEQQDPGALASRAFYAALYGDHPYASPPGGTAASLAALTRETVVAFHAKYYVAANAVVALVGDLDRATAERLAERVTSGLVRGAAVSPLPPVVPLDGPQQVHVDHPSAQVHVVVGQPGMKRGDPDYFALYLGNHILGGSGLVSRLNQAVREERGLAYSVYSYFLPMQESGPFQMALQTRADQLDEALGLLRDNLAQMVADGPTDAELEFSRQSVVGGFPMRIDSNRKLVGYLAMIGFYGLDTGYLERFTDRVRAVTRAQVRDALARRLDPSRLVTVTVGPPPG